MLKLFDLLAVSLICTLSIQLNAAEPRPFYHDSLEAIESAYSGQRFLLSVWSLECPPCMEELQILGELKSSYPDFNLVLVSTDAYEHSKNAEKFLAEFNLSELADSWIYGTDRPEKLRYSIDKDWYGEMPRSYFYDEQGKRQAASGLLSESLLLNWVQKTLD